eukprot:12812790-Alexandrium_andersonii.AAC.1
MQTLLQQQETCYIASKQVAKMQPEAATTENPKLKRNDHFGDGALRALTTSTRIHVSLGQNGPPNHSVF